ncbi:hypothetical protein SARC_04584 [Sphaeroforma arctica JP610]|uniref:WHIM1 domain-containing protein n=1 Tax=Sphaeroforma arctica JP610 TaxID=667725 RepID=A0A0L0G259_9EUKA|nr:hypothetical protein SARC_04584 [Sphaeroforma arctica JP610]KNC83155.1 hypothetical protein SARC_04584 [Sphaeroforma arctica JP610]|eukprot:XP_014157057.1 hypothetical protein SARC_04584 [Sphaeroforma arctica JP610]
MSTIDELRRTWELPYVAIYLRTFNVPFEVPYLDSETLEELLVSPTGLDRLESLALKLLSPFFRKKGEEYDVLLIREVSRRYPECVELDYLRDHKFAELTATQKLSVLRLLCDMRLEEASDVRMCLEGIEADLLRHEDIGEDKNKSKYYYFQDSRLWRETKTKKTTGKSRKRAREDSTWELVCSNAEEWETFASTLSKRLKGERNLHEVVQTQLMPEILEKEENRKKAEEARIRAEARRLKWEAMPRRVSRRVRDKIEEEARYAELEAEEESLRAQAEELARIEGETQKKLERSRERRYRERTGHSPTNPTRDTSDALTAYTEDHLSSNCTQDSPAYAEGSSASPASHRSVSLDSEIAGMVQMPAGASHALENRPSVRIHLKLKPREPFEEATAHANGDEDSSDSEQAECDGENRDSDGEKAEYGVPDIVVDMGV